MRDISLMRRRPQTDPIYRPKPVVNNISDKPPAKLCPYNDFTPCIGPQCAVFITDSEYSFCGRVNQYLSYDRRRRLAGDPDVKTPTGEATL